VNAGLDSAHRKWDRANEHLAILQEELRLFSQRDSVTLTPQRNGDRTQEWWIARIVEPVPFCISPLIGDLVHNLRSALDHIAHALASLKGPPHRGTAFPISSNRTKFFEREKDPPRRFTSTSGMNKLTGMRPAAQTFIERCQPYHGGGNSLLFSLATLDNEDKHRALNVTQMIPKYWGSETIPGVEVRVLRYAIVDGAPFAVATYERDRSEMQVNLQVAPDVGFPLTNGGAIEAASLMKQLCFWTEKILWDVRPLFGLFPPTDYINIFEVRREHRKPLRP
jgi:hypothetical protein